MQVKATREFEGMMGVKNDWVDATLIAETLRMGNYELARLATDDLQAPKELTRYCQDVASRAGEAALQIISFISNC